ncbi:hypothetical protein [Glaesserella parasuis]|uniref:Uncharacterized protein n=1 Tax=Glaesserella parasuis serovar 5 (strain SH0165) TaxID=557723 RepID=B8F7I4_GLAP5|nr:hypothetical protein [Glaesserella parasuis]ACL33286.1 hypothetical protein HAPS_1774 [Glaesserella parasuis SH0165]ATW44623.1 hypothetical protein A2U21_00805 [Glaesserella parasuis str. Nagasaki]AWY44693.1 hypothetical protein B4U42_01050 [Glaesserella parasuis 29755]EMY46197.1 hypothetical protein OE7_05845 [Glaesserella parasuis gx033]EQA00501.1 TAT (twin-arginine translocation) pathway signal sequence family protein [Glaesserella parasuis str. Nagasaki]
MLNLTRRSLLLGLGGAAALAITPSIANSAGFKVRSAQYSTKDRQVGLAYARSNDGILWEKT